MTEISQLCPCCNAEKHQATVNSCIKVTKIMQQEKLKKKHHPLCLCETCDEEIKTGKQMTNKWSRKCSLSKNETKRNIHECDLSPKR